jgi:hypothetical protein
MFESGSRKLGYNFLKAIMVNKTPDKLTFGTLLYVSLLTSYRLFGPIVSQTKC